MLHVVSALVGAFGLMASVYLIGETLRRNARQIIDALLLQTEACRKEQSHIRIVASQNKISGDGRETVRAERASVAMEVRGSNRSQRAA